MAPGAPRLGPGFQVKLLRRVCSWCRLGLLVSNFYSDGEEERYVLLKASRVCHVAGAYSSWVGCHPHCVVISYGRGIIVEA